MSGYHSPSCNSPVMSEDAYPIFEAFVVTHTRPGALALDIGCGQGKVALMLARHGYAVVAVDHSATAVEQITRQIQEEGICIDALVADYFDFEPQGEFDIIVLDTLFYLHKNDRKGEIAFLNRLSNHLSETGYLCFFVHRTPDTTSAIREWLNARSNHLSPVLEQEMRMGARNSDDDIQPTAQMLMLVLQVVSPRGRMPSPTISPPSEFHFPLL